MKLTQDQLDHVIFLSETIVENRKRHLMPEALQCLIHIVKTLQNADMLDEPAHETFALIAKIEQELIEENLRLQEIRHNMSHPRQSRPYV